MESRHFDLLDTIVEAVLAGDERRVGALPTEERLYVALASSRLDLVSDYSIVGAIERLGSAWLAALVERWRNRSIVPRDPEPRRSHTATDFDTLLGRVTADPATSYRLRARIAEDGARDPLDALTDAKQLYALNLLRADEALASAKTIVH